MRSAEVLLQRDLHAQISELCRAAGVTELLCEQELTVEQLEGMRAGIAGVTLCCDRTLSDAIRGLRAVKSEEKKQKILAAQAITDAAFSEILDFIRPGQTEKEVAARLGYAMRCRGADGFAFDTIVVSGENSSKPHGVPGERRLQKGDFITMDFGARRDGYCSDMTRTIALGEVSAEQKRVYDTVLQAHLASAAAARAGMTGQELDRVARDVIAAAGYGDCFGHSLGHSVGMDVHEAPMASPRYPLPLPAGTVMTIEPGIYLPGRFGVRIENMIYITETGSENLTASARSLICL